MAGQTYTEADEPIRSVVAPDVHPAGGGIVDSQQASTSPGDGTEVVGAVPFKDKIAGAKEVLKGKLTHDPALVEEGRERMEGKDRVQL